MNIYNDCNKCDKDCRCGECKPAKYNGSQFNIEVNPYDSLTWLVTLNGMTHKVRIPTIGETDTTLSTDQSNATLNYKAEKHRDTITGSQLGDLVRLGDLRDVDFSPTLDSGCYELIYRKQSECALCGQSPVDKWYSFNINDDNAKQDSIRYVRGASADGCPVYLDMPTNTDEYWFAGWRKNGEHKEFGYFKPKDIIGELPKDENGNYIIGSYDPETDEPLVGKLPISCAMRSLVTSLAFDIFSTWNSTMVTVAPLSSTFNNMTGEFVLYWEAKRGPGLTIRVGHGNVYGKVNWETSFNMADGSMEYRISSIYFDKTIYTPESGLGGVTSPKITIKAISMPDRTYTTIIDARPYGDTPWEIIHDTTIAYDQPPIIAYPNETKGPFPFVYVFDDWIGDDEGELGINFHNKLIGWGC